MLMDEAHRAYKTKLRVETFIVILNYIKSYIMYY